jgi:predicted MFS family arabinose efflux permease
MDNATDQAVAKDQSTKGKIKAGRAWGIFIILFIVQVIFSEALMKPAGVMANVMGGFGVNVTVAGLLMTINGIGAAIITIFGSGVMQRIGPRKVALIALGLSIVAQIVAYFFGGSNYTVLLATRFFEGGAYGLISTALPVMIAAIFPPEKRGLPNGIYTLNIAFGMIIILNSENFITPSYGYLGAWIYCAVQAIILAILFLLFARIPKGQEYIDNASDIGETNKVKLSTALKNINPWCIVLVMFAFSVCNGAWTTYYPTYLISMGMEQAAANVATTVGNYAMIVGGILIGVLLMFIPIKRRPITLLILTVFYAIVTIFMFDMPTASIAIPYMIVYGLFAQMLTPMMLTIIPDISVKGTVAISMGMYIVAMSCGGFLSTLIVGPFVDLLGSWAAITIPYAILCILAIGAALIIYVRARKQIKQEVDA